MLLLIVLSNLLCLLLPAFAFAHVATSEDPVNLAAHHVKRLSNPLKNLLHKRDAVLSAGGINVPSALALNSTDENVEETVAFEATIDIPGQGHTVYFLVKGEVDISYSATVEFWYYYRYVRRIGVYQGYLKPGVDMKIADSSKIMQGEAQLYTVVSGEWVILVFEAYGSVHLPFTSIKQIPPFAKPIKRWKPGNLSTMQDAPDTLEAQTLSNVTVTNTSVSAE